MYWNYISKKNSLICTRLLYFFIAQLYYGLPHIKNRCKSCNLLAFGLLNVSNLLCILFCYISVYCRTKNSHIFFPHYIQFDPTFHLPIFRLPIHRHYNTNKITKSITILCLTWNEGI